MNKKSKTTKIAIAKGYSGAWIEKRMRGIEVRETLTNEWKKRGVIVEIIFGNLAR